jgi:hypothetical protein
MRKSVKTHGAKKGRLTCAVARKAARAAKKAYALGPAGPPSEWKKGGRAWVRILGRFGAGG